jgi:hypothetical protein
LHWRVGPYPPGSSDKVTKKKNKKKNARAALVNAAESMDLN